jgi:hypothetical protein
MKFHISTAAGGEAASLINKKTIYQKEKEEWILPRGCRIRRSFLRAAANQNQIFQIPNLKLQTNFNDQNTKFQTEPDLSSSTLQI